LLGFDGGYVLTRAMMEHAAIVQIFFASCANTFLTRTSEVYQDKHIILGIVVRKAEEQ
jgi:hypothetical protein